MLFIVFHTFSLTLPFSFNALQTHAGSLPVLAVTSTQVIRESFEVWVRSSSFHSAFYYCSLTGGY